MKRKELSRELASRLSEIEARLGITDAPAPASPQGPAQTYDVRCPDCGRTRNDELMRAAGFEAEQGTQPPAEPDYVPPAGIVSPHVRQNLAHLAEWMNPQRVWGMQSAGEAKRVEALLTHLHGLVMVAMAGGDVPHPDEPPADAS